MQQRSLGGLWPDSVLTLGGGGIGMVWGETSFDECVATVRDAVTAGINLIDLAPTYGNGKAEEVVGETFDGRLPQGVRVTSKCGLGNAAGSEVEPMLRRSNRAELAECVAAAEAGPLPADMIARIDQSVDHVTEG